MITKLAQFTDIRAAIVVGGLSMAQQASELRKGPEIVVATPGRIIDHILNTMSFELDSLSTLVLDEADRLLDMGFMEEVCARFCIHLTSFSDVFLLTICYMYATLAHTVRPQHTHSLPQFRATQYPVISFSKLKKGISRYSNPKTVHLHSTN